MKRRIALLLALLASQPTVGVACMTCASTISYNNFRFAPIWIVLLFLWFAARVRLDGKSGTDGQTKRTIRVIWVYPTTVFLVAVFTGLHLLLALAAPVLPLVAVMSPKSPKHHRYAGAIFLLAFLISAPIAQWVSPYVCSEPEARATVSKCNLALTAMGDFVESRFPSGPPWPKPASLRTDEKVYSVLPEELLREIVNSDNLESTSDPFATRQAIYPLSYLVGPGLPPNNFFRRITEGFDGAQYLAGEKGFVFWMRGPDGVFSKGLERELENAVHGEPHAVVDYAYDPSNGSFSDGDLWDLRQF